LEVRGITLLLLILLKYKGLGLFLEK